MNPQQRRQSICEQVERKGVCAYEELSALLGVCSMTIRRDVDQLAREGLVIKTLGGIQRAAEASLYESDLLARLMTCRPQKRHIAREALRLVQPRQTLFLDGGTTCLELAKLLAAGDGGLTVVTNSAQACMELGRGKGNMTVGIGGQYDAASASFVGPTAEESAARFFVDVAFMSTKGLIPDEGTFESAIATFRIKQIIARQAGRVVLLADHTKFNQRALSKVLDISQLHVVITDSGALDSDLARLRRNVKQVVIAEELPNPSSDEVSCAH
ncbi:MAG: DeoR/GlpR transcriptional regulator [Phycisphaeraceae bacterium]|nr:DeoR/GlpR transcriptional regulator [Phycisphaeraceae bacterium]